jgi:hypothetical protein
MGGAKTLGNFPRFGALQSDDNTANPGGMLVKIVGKNGTAYGIVGVLTPDADGISAPNDDDERALATVAFTFGVDDTGLADFPWVPFHFVADDGENQVPSGGPGNSALVMARGSLFNDAQWTAARDASADNIGGLDGEGAALVAQPGHQSAAHTPAAATQATISIAGSAGRINVCTAIDATLIIPPAVNQPVIQLVLRDGATGVGAILWSRSVGFGAAVAAGYVFDISIAGLSIPGTAGAAMTLEFTAAGAATTVQSVALNVLHAEPA